MANFVRKDLYLVLKVADVVAALDSDARTRLNEILDTVSAHRASRSKPPLQCVVVEEDWPEYETVWRMIEDRCTPTGASSSPVSRSFAPLLNARFALLSCASKLRGLSFHYRGRSAGELRELADSALAARDGLAGLQDDHFQPEETEK